MTLSTRWLLLGGAAIVLVVHSLTYNFVTDDAYISFVYSRNLAEHGQLTFNLGDHVEGYTNFLWTAILGVLMVPGIPPEVSSRVLGMACALGTLWLVERTMQRALARQTSWCELPAFVLACSSGYACWTSGGLETQLFTVLVAAAIDGLVAGNLRRVAIALALASMTRPEGPLIAAVFGAVWAGPRALHRRWPGRAELVAAAWFVALWAPWFAWRWWYYGWPFPNTYYVKASGPWTDAHMGREMYEHGAHYVAVWLWQTKVLLALPLAIVGLVAGVRAWDSPRSRLQLACAGLVVFYVPYVISVGGDFMGLHRFIMPLFVVAAIAVTLGLERFAAWRPALRRPIALNAAVIAIGFVLAQLALTIISLDPHNTRADDGVIDTPAFLIGYTEDRAAIGRAMEPCFEGDDFSVVGGAGAQPYFGRMRAIDAYGLVSDRVAHEMPRGRARAGHTKFASDELIRSLDPTFVFSCYSLDSTLPARNFNSSPQTWLAHGYELVTLEVPGMHQAGPYYTFLAKKARHFECPGRVR